MDRIRDRNRANLVRTLTEPWALLLAGLAMALLGLAVSFISLRAMVPVRLVLLVGGVTVAGGAVSLRLKRPWQTDRFPETAAVFVAASAAAPLLASFGMGPDWDSAVLVLRVLTAAALVGAVLVQVPRWLRRLAVSLAILFHFGGILCAVTTVPAGGLAPPWWSTKLWVHVYHNYLDFAYLTNAYHFYSPNPGPPTLLWFRVEYEDRKYRWVKVPLRENYRTRLQFQRPLGISESTNDPTATPPALLQRRLSNRIVAGWMRGIPFDESAGAPGDQYRRPSPTYSQPMLATYARHVAVSYPSKKDPGLKVVGVKVYKVTHNMLSPKEFQEGEDPLDPRLYTAYFMGEFDSDGGLKPDDGFRYWLLPIKWVPYEEVRYANFRFTPLTEGKGVQRKVLIDSVRIHAGDTDEGEK